MIASQDLADTDIVVIFGTDRRDKIRIDSSVAAEFDGSVEIHGGDRHDMLIVEGTGGDDTISVEATAVYVNASGDEGLSVFFGNNVEQLRVDAGNGDDLVAVNEENGPLTVDLILAGRRGNDILVGGSGNDLILGGAGHDIVVGGSGVMSCGEVAARIFWLPAAPTQTCWWCDPSGRAASAMRRESTSCVN